MATLLLSHAPCKHGGGVVVWEKEMKKKKEKAAGVVRSQGTIDTHLPKDSSLSLSLRDTPCCA
jgi:hypothetical protein